MNRLAILACFGALSSCALEPSFAANEPVFLSGDVVVNAVGVPADQVQSPVVALRVAFTDSDICTAFHVGSYLVTAGHCYFDSGKPDKFVGTLDNDKQVIADLWYASDASAGYADVAILTLEDAMTGWPSDTLDCTYKPATGDDLTTRGFPGANAGVTFAKGYVNGPNREIGPWVDAIPVTMVIAPGHSGSPVYHDGKVVGILVGINTAQPGWAYVQPLGPVCDKLKGETK